MGYDVTSPKFDDKHLLRPVEPNLGVRPHCSNPDL